MKQKTLVKHLYLYLFCLSIFLILSFNQNILAQDTDTLEKIIKGNEFLLKSDFSMNIGLGITFDNFLSTSEGISYYFLYDFAFSYQLFNWLSISTIFSLNLNINLDDCWLDLNSLYLNFNFNEIFTRLPFQLLMKFGIYPYDLSIYSIFYGDTPYYYGITQFYVEQALPSALLNIKWWLLDIYTGIFGIEDSAAFFKVIFSFYDFAYLSLTSLVPININAPNISTQFFIELALTTGLFDIIAYLLPSTYLDTATDQDLSTFCFGINASLSFIIANSNNLKLSLYFDYIDQNAVKAFTTIDYLNEINYPSTYSFANKHPTRVGTGLEYKGNFSKNFSIIAALFFYYNLSLNTFVININSKFIFYYFYFDINYFPYYYPVLSLNNFSLSLGINFAF